MTSLSERFLKFVGEPTETGCTLWLGCLRGKGYGSFSINGKSCIASRVSYLLNKGDPAGKIVCHTCNNPRCVNPDHLYIGTYSDNTQQSVREGRMFVAKGELNGSAKLTEQQVNAIKNDSRTQRPIAKDYNISQLHVSRIKRGIAWRYL